MDEGILAKLKDATTLTDDELGAIRAELRPDITSETLASLARAIREAGPEIAPPEGGEHLALFASGSQESLGNSAAAAIVAAACGASVAAIAHWGRNAMHGAAETLRTLGVKIEHTPEQAARMIAETGAAFIDAPHINPAITAILDGASPEERELFRDAVLPLVNPAIATRCYIGVGRPELQPAITEAAKQLGFLNGMIVSGGAGEGEMSMCGPTHVNELMNGSSSSYDVTPEDNAIESCTPDLVRTASAKEAAYVFRSVLSGKLKGPRREAIVYNAAAAVMSAGKAGYFARGLLNVRNVIDSGDALKKLDQIKELSNKV